LDPLTHTLTGLYLSRAGLNRLMPRSAVLLMLAANAPDIDVITLAAGPAAALHWHRHFTHSFAFSPVLALALVAIVRLAGPLPWLRAWAAAWIAICSHILLDLTNVYGTRAAWPFSGAWLHWDLTNIFDVWLWAVLLAALAGPFLGRLVGGEITSGAGRAPRHFGQGWAAAALLLALFYDGGRGVLHARAETVLQSRVYDGAEPQNVAAYPNAFNPLEWRGTVQTEAAYYFYALNLSATFDPTAAAPVYPADPGPALPALHTIPVFHEFLEFNQAPLWQSTPSATWEHARRLRLTDLRFGVPGESAFECEAVVTAQNKVAQSECSFGPGGRGPARPLQ
jgi:inner membrane protein